MKEAFEKHPFLGDGDSLNREDIANLYRDTGIEPDEEAIDEIFQEIGR